MKRMVFFITLAFLISVSIVLLPVQLYAQKNVTIINPSFEKPDSGKIEGFMGKTTHTGTGFKVLVVPAWKVNSPDSSVFDSGVDNQGVATNGNYVAYLMGGDSALYQNLNRRLNSDDQLMLTVDAMNSYIGTTLKMELFYNDGDSVTGAIIPIVSETKTMTSKMAAYSISVKGSDFPDVQGLNIGILFQNVTPGAHSWIYIDNVRLTNEDPTIVEVPNYSFEQPDSGKIEGWNGPGSCPKIADSQADIPGWASDSIVTDSGIERNSQGGDGQYSAFLAWDDDSIWNTTNYSIQAGDVISLRVNGRASWIATQLHIELYYANSGKRITLASAEEPLDPTGVTWAEYSISFKASDFPASVGKQVGVLLKNTSTVTNSWAAADFVRLNANHSVTAVSGTQMKPAVFSLAQNYPNPFNPTTNISYTLKNSGKVRLSVYDMLGREVAVLANENQIAGQHEVKFAASCLSSGIYFYKLQSASGVITKKMMLLK